MEEDPSAIPSSSSASPPMKPPTDLEIEDINIPSIVDSISQQQIDEFQPFHKRYFEEKFCTKFTNEERNLDTRVRVHSNKVSIIYLSEKHSIFKSGQSIKRLNFQVSAKINRLKNKTVGKGKKGAQLLKPDAILCFIETEDGITYPVHSGIYGKLLEINSQINDNPNLILDNKFRDGFIAIILPDLHRHEENMNSLKNQAEYNS